jgi:hypothetical protein
MSSQDAGHQEARVWRKLKDKTVDHAVCCACVIATFAVLPPFARADDAVRVAAWNMNNLHYEVGVPLREGAPARSEADYAILRKYAALLNADIVALQEVNGPRAAAMVFSESDYTLHFSGRYVEDVEGSRDSDRIYEGFAVRRGVFDAITKRNVPELGVQHTDGRSVRWGTELLVERNGRRLVLMSVHLKSGCAEGSLENTNKPNCMTLAKQRAPLNRWIDDHTAKRRTCRLRFWGISTGPSINSNSKITCGRPWMTEIHPT